MEEQYKYWAFISYSHQDSEWADWLHKALESYTVPRRLVGQTTRLGPIPRRLFPVFRDRDELSSSSQLGDVINQALRQSRYLIVICSPRAAASRWVNEEIRYFKALGREDRVLALIVDGEPGSANRGDPQFECFPPALHRRLHVDGSLGEQPFEPIAADARRHHGSRPEARLKLITGLLDIGYDELRQRERSKLFWRRLKQAGLAAALALAIGAAWEGEAMRRNERAHQAELLRLFDAGRKEALLEHPARAAVLLNAAYSGGYDNPALRLLLRRAMKSFDAQSPVRSHHDDESPGAAAWLPDGKRFVTLWKNTKLWDADSGKLLATYANTEFSASLGISVSADGRHLLASGRAGFSEESDSLDLFDIESGKLILHFAGTASCNELGPAFRSIAPDGRSIALIGSGDGQLAIHATDDGRLLRRFATRPLGSAAFSSDGRALVTADDHDVVTIWDMASGRRRTAFSGGQRADIHAFFLPDDRILVTDRRGKIKIYDSSSGALIDALGGHTQAIRLAKVSDDNRRLLTNAGDGTKIWDLATGDQLLQVSCDCPISVRFDFDATGSRLLSKTDSTRVGLWDVDAARLLTTFEGHNSDISAMLFSTDGKRLLSAGLDGDAVIWTLAGLQPDLRVKLLHDAPLALSLGAETYSGRYSPDGKTLVTVGTDGTTRLWNAADGAPLHVLRGHTKTVYHAAFSPDGKLLATASDDLTARLWDVASGTPRAVLDGHNRFVRRVVFSPDGSRLLTVAGTEPRIWDTEDGRLVAKLSGLAAPAVEGTFSADGRRVLTTGIDGVPRVFDAETGAERLKLEGHQGVVPFAVFVDGDRRIVSAGVDGTARVWDANTGRILSLLNEPLAGAGGFRNGTLSHNGQYVLLAASTGELLLWDFDQSPRRFIGHSVASYWSEFSADDRLVVSASNDGTSRIWSTDTGLPIKVLRINTRLREMWSAAFSPDALHVVTTGNSDPPTAEIWDIPRETRSAAEIATILRCKSPWKLQGEQLVAHRPETDACAALTPQ